MDGRRIACDRCGAEVGAEERHAEIEYVYGDGGGNMTLCRDCFKLVMDTVHGQEAKRQGDAESPTMDERRAVARRLRALVGGRIDWTGLQRAVFGGTALRSDTVARLAELIDPGDALRALYAADGEPPKEES